VATYNGNNVKVYVNTLLMLDRDLAGVNAISQGGGARLEITFDVPLGMLKAGDVIYVCSGPNSVDAADGFLWDFTISMGVNPLLTFNKAYQAMPLFGGAKFTTVTVVWSGTTAANTWNTIVTGGPNSRLATGTYILSMGATDSNSIGGGLWREGVVSAPFYWDTLVTNDVTADAISTHMSGHASNLEVISFQTLRQMSPKFLLLQFKTTRAWTTANELEFTFLRLL
jgi:hypothetical protein